MSSNGNKEIIESTIYRQYIHHKPTPINNIISKFKAIDFILSFAGEDYDAHGKGTGNFHPTWSLAELNIEWLKKLKEDVPHARVVISIGGVDSEFPFDPIEKHIWIYNAINSIKRINHDYYNNLIDGIDIHYDVIKSSVDQFSNYIGEFIRQLKNDTDLSINVVSIAPNKPFESYYRYLYFHNKYVIDIIHYAFYDMILVEEVEQIYKKLVAIYTPTIVLPIISFDMDPIVKEFFENLLKNKLIPGIVVWDIDNPLLAPTLSL
ncbi:chitinase 2-like [Cicer arietinum]|uniref:Uncharacterized protein LOC113785475 n=1 Tax=Cicer arietinum TaxID=3827 RepID=A0A3Q7Y8E1_CICAR|nr:uncharacterized protein LOC113785475 [Cicer arietinum]